MSQARAKRVGWLAAILLVAFGFGISLIKVFNENLVFFYTPSQIVNQEVKTDQKSMRIGGMVEVGSVIKAADSLQVSFVVTDKNHAVPVTFTGILPDLFKEGTGVVADGRWNGTTFQAHEVLAKHDEDYMPPGVEQ